jgi:branched-subunit amino acid transport protein
VSDGLTAALVLAGGVYLLKAAGPMLLGNRSLPRWLDLAAALLPAALLAALVVVSTISGERQYIIDARILGVGAAGIALWRKAPFIVAVLAAAAVTAAARACGLR